MSRWHNTRLSPADWEADVETRLLEERLPEMHVPTPQEASL